MPAAAQDVPDLAAYRERIETGDARAAVRDLDRILARNPINAELMTLIAYGYRHQEKFDLARRYYEAVLTFEPDYLPALGYLGDLEVLQGNREAAQALRERLETLCPEGCEPLDNLTAAIEAAE